MSVWDKTIGVRHIPIRLRRRALAHGHSPGHLWCCSSPHASPQFHSGDRCHCTRPLPHRCRALITALLADATTIVDVGGPVLFEEHDLLYALRALQVSPFLSRIHDLPSDPWARQEVDRWVERPERWGLVSASPGLSADLRFSIGCPQTCDSTVLQSGDCAPKEFLFTFPPIA